MNTYTICWFNDTELEVEVEWGSDVHIVPRGRIDWDEEPFIYAEQVLVTDKKGRTWDISDRMDEDDLQKLAEIKMGECEDARNEAKLDAYEARMEQDFDDYCI